MRSLILFKEQSLINLRTLFCWVHDEVLGSSSITLVVPPVSGLPACGRHRALLPSGRGFRFCKRGQRSWLRILSIALETELTVHEFV